MKRILAAAIMLTVFCAAPASAHHLRGLPHYSYEKNYPQTPSYEETHKNGDYEVAFSYYDIFNTKNIDMGVYIKNLKTGEAYKGPVEFRVRGINEDPTESEKNHPYIANATNSNTYKANWVYEDDGVYILRVTFEGGDGIIEEEFRFTMGKVGFNKLFIFGGIGSLVALMLAVAAVRGRQGNNEAA